MCGAQIVDKNHSVSKRIIAHVRTLQQSHQEKREKKYLDRFSWRKIASQIMTHVSYGAIKSTTMSAAGYVGCSKNDKEEYGHAMCGARIVDKNHSVSKDNCA